MGGRAPQQPGSVGHTGALQAHASQPLITAPGREGPGARGHTSPTAQTGLLQNFHKYILKKKSSFIFYNVLRRRFDRSKLRLRQDSQLADRGFRRHGNASTLFGHNKINKRFKYTTVYTTKLHVLVHFLPTLDNAGVVRIAGCLMNE